MRAAARLAAALALPALLLAGCEAMPGGAPEAGPAPGPLPPAALAALLPTDAAGFQRGQTLPLAHGEPGQEVAYATRGLPAAAATVQIRAPSGDPVPDGPDSPAAATAFNRLVQEALRPEPQRRLREVARFVLPETAPALRCAETEGRYGRERVRGLVCAGGLRGNVVSLRLATPQSEPPPADPRAFAAAIATALRRP